MVERSIIRKMVVADVPAVCMIDEAVDIMPWSAKLLTDCINVGYECWVLTQNLLIIGFGIMSYGANEAHLLKLAIHPDHHRRGLGQQLLQYLLHLAKSHGSEEIFLEVRVSNDVAIKLYEKNNFVEIGMRKGYYPANEQTGHPAEDALTMALPLW